MQLLNSRWQNGRQNTGKGQSDWEAQRRKWQEVLAVCHDCYSKVGLELKDEECDVFVGLSMHHEQWGFSCAPSHCNYQNRQVTPTIQPRLVSVRSSMSQASLRCFMFFFICFNSSFTKNRVNRRSRTFNLQAHNLLLYLLSYTYHTVLHDDISDKHG